MRVIFEKVAHAAKEFKDNLSDAFGKIGDLPGVKKLTDAVSEFKRVIVDPAISKAVKSFGKFATGLNIKVPNVDSFLSFIDKIASKLGDFVKKIVDAKNNIKSTTDEIGDSFSIFGVIKNTVCGAIDFIKEKIESISEAFKSLKPSLSIGGSALNGFKNGFVGAISSFANSGATISTATNGITSVMEYIQTFFAKFTTWLAKIQMTIQQFGISISVPVNI